MDNMCLFTVDVYPRKKVNLTVNVSPLIFINVQPGMKYPVNVDIKKIKDMCGNIYIRFTVTPNYCLHGWYTALKDLSEFVFKFMEDNIFTMHSYANTQHDRGCWCAWLGNTFGCRERCDIHRIREQYIYNCYDKGNKIMELLKKHNSNKRVLGDQKQLIENLDKYKT